MILNLGCGKKPISGYLNVDIYGGDIIANAESLPFRNESFNFILASHVLEHVSNLQNSMKEIHRILKPGGILEARVPTGLKTIYNPFHVRSFDLHTLKGFCREGDRSYEEQSLFIFLESVITSHILPFAYHLQKYTPFLLYLSERMGFRRFENGRPTWRIPLTPREEIKFLLMRPET